jgi:hypothetical protein
LGKWYLSFVLLAFVTWAITACKHEPVPNLLSGLSPSRIENVNHPERLTDNVRAPNGDNWDTSATSTFVNPDGVIEYDLGSDRRISAVYIQGDNNDEYLFSVSSNGKDYREVWVAPPSDSPGMQGRSTGSLNTSARYVRITARGGDRFYSIGELQVFSDPRGLSSGSFLAATHGLPTPDSIRGKTMMLVFAFAVWLFLNWRYSPLYWTALTALIPAWYAFGLYNELSDSWPVQMREVAFMRGAMAALAGFAILRELVFKRAFPALRWPVLGTLGVAAALSFLSFFNLGAPQFRDYKDNQPLFVHNFDMRVYYPVAKYFKELRYDGLYQASVAAYVADDPNANLDSLANVELRDLRNHQITRVHEVRQQIENIPKRFSDARWEAFKVDMRYFRQTMGVNDYLGSMKDHGGNATPVWTAIAHLLFAGTTASNATLTLGALLDPILLLAAFIAIYRSFGLRTSLMSVVLFGANDFYMFGSNWAGATLRHDWMVYLALGICALKVGRWTMGGVFLALSAAIRAFPAFALVGVGIAFAWQLWAYYREHGKLPTYAKLMDDYRPMMKTLAGAAACVAVVVVFSSLVFDPHAWVEWIHKVSILDRDPHVNDVSLRAAVAGVNHLQLVALGQRAPLHLTLIAFYLLLVALAVRNKPLDQAAAITTIMIPVVFNPANYYAHFIFVLPMIAVEQLRNDNASGKSPLSGFDGWIWGTMLLVCVAQYWTTLTTDLELHFEMASVLLCGAFIVLLVLILYRDRDVWLPASKSQSLCWLLRRTKAKVRD